MDVLLINPPREVPQKADFPPVGLAYISALLKKNGISSSVVDAVACSRKELARIIESKKPAIVGITCWTMERGEAFKTAEQVRQLRPAARIIVGGHHATAFPENMFPQMHADAVVIGEGEETTLELVRALLGGTSLASVNGIAWLDNGVVRVNQPRPFALDLDALPYPDYSDLDLHGYLGIPDAKGIAASIMTSRGCPHQCVFCSAGSFWKRKWRARTAENVLGEIEWLYRERGVRNFSFFDDNFTVRKSRAIEICKGILDRKLSINWVASSHVTHVEEEVLYWMKKSGCFRIDFGVESGSPAVLRNIQKGQTVEQIEKAFALVHAAGIKPRAYLLVGSPGETEETIDETIALMKKIRPYYSRTATITLVFPGTGLYDQAKRCGLLDDGFWLKSNDTLCYTCEHPQEELDRLKERLMRGLALNDNTFMARLEFIARRIYYRYPALQKLRRFRRIFK
jgi:radical SAM superfamily enzyme YgiQ (UPF0313 family)